MAKTATIRSRKHAHGMYPLLGSSLFALGALTGAVNALAADATPVAEGNALPETRVKATREAPAYKVENSASNKLTQPLLDTPKSVQIVKKEMLREQGAVSLMDALRNTPGITMQLGENGNTSAGDAFQMRGFSSQNSVFIDGVRDTGAVSRDVFNLEQVEIIKGPAGSETGRGSASGYINLITKLPFADSLSDLSVSYGSANRKRGTVDLNRQINDTTAFRLNVMAQDGGVDGVDVAKNRGMGVAPSLAFGLGTPTRIFMYGQHVHQDDIPQGGIPSIGLPGYYRGRTALNAEGTNGEQVTSVAEGERITALGRRVDTSNFYGSKKDYAKVNADAYSIKSEFDLSSTTTLRNISRFSRTHMDRVLTSISINGGNIRVGGVSGAGAFLDPADWTITRSRQRIDQLNESLVNQTSINSTLTLGGIKHDLAAGLELMSERQYSKGTTAPTANTIPVTSLYNPNSDDVLPLPALSGIDTDGQTVTSAIYALDTLTLNDAVKLNGGVRFEHYKTTTQVTNAAGLKVGDNLLSWNLGAVYKPAPNGSVYVGLANSLTPPGGNNFVLNATSTNQANPTMDPQETATVEVGTKWDLFNEKLNVAAAIYRTENDKQTSTDSLGVTTQFGKTRVQGIELSAVGQLTNFWQLTAAMAYMETKQLDQYSTTNVQTTGVRWSPKFSASVWSSYQLGDFTLGGGVRYLSEQKRVVNTDNQATQPLPKVPAYEVFDLMGAYKLNKNVNLQLNVQNVFDKEYITVNNAGTRLMIGAPRAYTLSANMKF
jgi:catecholate siderophore receptor